MIFKEAHGGYGAREVRCVDIGPQAHEAPGIEQPKLPVLLLTHS